MHIYISIPRRGHVLCLWQYIPVWWHIGPGTTDTSRHRRDMTSDVSKRRKNLNKQANKNSFCALSYFPKRIISTPGFSKDLNSIFVVIC